MMNCPVCPANNIPDESDTCPGCGTDLSPLRRVRELSSALYQEAIDLANNGATDIAVQKTVSSLCLDEQQVEARVFLGKLHWKKRQFQEALDQWSRVTAASPENEAAKALMARAKQQLRNQSIRKWAGLIILICFFGFPPLVLFTIHSRHSLKFTSLKAFDVNTTSSLNIFDTRLGELEQKFDRQTEQLSSVLDNTIERQIQTQFKSLVALADSVDSITEKTKAMELEMPSILRSQDQSDDRMTQIAEDVRMTRERNREIMHSTEITINELNTAISSLKSLHLAQIGSLVDLCQGFLRSCDDRYQRSKQQLQEELNHVDKSQSRRRRSVFSLFGPSRRDVEQIQKEQIEEELAILKKEYEAVVGPIQQTLEEMKVLQNRANR